jgi:hypothetical protein
MSLVLIFQHCTSMETKENCLYMYWLVEPTNLSLQLISKHIYIVTQEKHNIVIELVANNAGTPKNNNSESGSQQCWQTSKL